MGGAESSRVVGIIQVNRYKFDLESWYQSRTNFYNRNSRNGSRARLIRHQQSSIVPGYPLADLRAIKQAENFQEKIIELKLEDSLSNNGTAWGTVARLLWIRDNFPEKYNAISKVVFPKDYLRYRLTGIIATDFGDAIASQMFDFKRGEWSQSVLEILGLPVSVFPEVKRFNEFAGFVNKETSKETGLSSSTKVVVGAGDWETFLYGLGSLSLREGYIYLGSAPTFGIILDRKFSHQVLKEGSFFLDRYGDSQDRWHLSGSMGMTGDCTDLVQ